MPLLEKTLRSFIIIAVFAAVLITPFIFSSSLFFPYIVGKALFFRIIVTSVFASWIILMTLNRRYLPKINLVTVILGLFLLWVMIANLLGINPSSSIWSNFERMEGYINLVNVFGLFLVTTTVFDSKKLWFRLFNLSIFAASIMGMVALGEYAEGTSRAYAFLGNPIYLASYMLFHAFLSFYFFLNYFKEKFYILFLYGGLTTFFISLVLVTGTRGAMLGLVTGLFLSTLLVALRKDEQKLIKRLAISGLVAVSLIGGVFASVVYINNSETALEKEWMNSFNESVKNLPAVNRFSRISLDSGDAKARFLLWKIAIEGIKERPVLGIGQENFIHLFNYNYDPWLFERETWFDRPHNIFLDWGVSGGVPAMVLYIMIFTTAVFLLWRSKDLDYYIKVVFSGLFLAHAVQSFFVFENITSHVYFAIFLAFVVSITTERKEAFSEKPLFSKSVINYFIIPVVLFCFFMVFYGVHIKALQANTSVIKLLAGIECASQAGKLPWGEATDQSATQLRSSACNQYLPDDLKSRFSKNTEYSTEEIIDHIIERSLKYFLVSSKKSLIGSQEAKELVSMQMRKVISSGASEKTKAEYFNQVEIALRHISYYQGEEKRPITFLGRLSMRASIKGIYDQDIVLNSPLNTRTLFFLGQLYIDAGMYEKALKTFEDALITAPNRQHILITLGDIHNIMGEYGKANEYFKRAYELESSFKGPSIRYAASSIYIDDEETFRKVLEPFNEREILFQEDLLRPFIEMKKYDRVIEIRKKRIEFLVGEFSGDEGGASLSQDELKKIGGEYELLIKTYYDIGEVDEAISVAEEVIQDFPQLEKAASNLIEEMKKNQ